MRFVRSVFAVVFCFGWVGSAFSGPTGGSITGKVTFEGAPPKPKPIDMSSEPECAKMYSAPPVTEVPATGVGNTLQGALVYISAGAPNENIPATSVTLTQKGCRYVPHVLVVLVNQELKITNDDQATHNIHPQPKLNREWNRSQPPGAPPITEKYGQAEIIPVKCNVHPWMRGYLVVLPNSHFAFSGENGGFTLPNLPPGKYTVAVWQEGFGELSQEVTITGSETKIVNFVLKAKPR